MEALTRFAGLPTRPPTPPKGHDVDKNDESHNARSLHSLQNSYSLDTPIESPSFSDYFPRSSDKTGKHVGFKLDTRTTERVSTAVQDVVSADQIRPLVTARKPSKSILKSSSNLPPSDPPSHESLTPKKQDLTSMLDDLIRQLTNPGLSTRFDAYMALNGCLKAYKDLPSQRSLVDKMPLLTKFIHRDLSEVEIEEKARNTQLVLEAVKLVTTFLWSPTLGESLPDTFQSFILNHAISAIANGNTPKTLSVQYLHLLTVQNFRPKIMTTEKASRLLVALQTIEDRATSKRVVASRFLIYKRLVGQAKSSMIAHVGDWIDHLFQGVLSNIRDIRERAISLGFEAGLALGTVEQVSKAVRGVFNSRVPSEGSETKYADMLLKRMVSWIGSDEDALDVPQIWSMVILFLRSQPGQFDRWAHMQAWLRVIQKCFNSSNVKLKYQTNKAWARFIFTIQPDATTADRMVKLLLYPVQIQMGRSKNPENDKKNARQFAKVTYCTLLYYAFRPGVDQEGLSRFWKLYISSVLYPCIDAKTACEILVSLFGDGSKKLWDVNRANGAQIKPDELPPLDAKWIRSRAGTILGLLETVLCSDSWWITENGEAFAIQVWRGFTKALSDAGNKEVKVSMEAMTAIAEIVSCLKRFFLASWSSSPSQDRSLTLQRFSNLVLVAVDNIGALPFTERRLIQSSTDSDAFQVAETPTSRSIKPQGSPASPIHHLLDLLSSSVDDEHTNDAYRDTIQTLLSVSLRPATSRRSRLGVLRDISRRTVTESLSVRKANVVLWEAVASSASTLIEDSKNEEDKGDGSQAAGQVFRDAVKIIEAGVQQGSDGDVSQWADVLRRVGVRLHKEAGSGASVLCLIEPLAKFLEQTLLATLSEGVIERCIILFGEVVWPKSRKDVEFAQRMLWGSVSSTTKSKLFNPFDHFYSLMTGLLRKLYQNSNTIESRIISRALHAVKAFIISSPLPLHGVLLRRMEDGLTCWIEDVDGKADTKAIFEAVIQLWETTVEKVQRFQEFNSTSLSLIEEPLRAGFSSRHNVIVNKTILMWNATFGLADALEYPENLRTVLMKLSLLTELHLPSVYVENGESELDSTPLDFTESLDDSDRLGHFDNADTVANNPLSSSPRSECVTAEKIASSPASAAKTPETSPYTKTPTRRSHPTPQLRHDDSQIEFAVVNFSPADIDELESQILTDRQKEVRERQNKEAAAIFPDLRSSPTPKSRSRDVNTPRLQIGTQVNSNEHLDPEETQSPTLPSPNHMYSLLGSSPTPSHRRPSSQNKSSSQISPFLWQGQAHANSSPPSSPPLHARRSITEASIQARAAQRTPRESSVYRESSSTVQPEILDLANEMDDYVMETEEHGPQDSEFDDSVFLDMREQILADSIAAAEGSRMSGPDTVALVDVLKNPPSPAEQLVEPEAVVSFGEELTSRSPSPVEAANIAMQGAGNYENVLIRSVRETSPDPNDLISSQIALEMERASQNSASSKSCRSLSEDVEASSDEWNSQETEDIRLPRRRGRPRKRPKQIEQMKESARDQEGEILDCIVVSSSSDRASKLDSRPNKPDSDITSPHRVCRKRSMEEMETETDKAPVGGGTSKSVKRARITRDSQQDASADNEESLVLPRRRRARAHRSAQARQSEGSSSVASMPEQDIGEAALQSKRIGMIETESSHGSAVEATDHPSPEPEPTSDAMQQLVPQVEAAQVEPAVEVEAVDRSVVEQGADLVDQLGALVETAKRGGIAPEQKQSIVLMSMELMKMAALT